MSGVSRAQLWGGAGVLTLACAGVLPLWWTSDLAVAWWRLLSLCTAGATQ